MIWGTEFHNFTGIGVPKRSSRVGRDKPGCFWYINLHSQPEWNEGGEEGDPVPDFLTLSLQ